MTAHPCWNIVGQVSRRCDTARLASVVEPDLKRAYVATGLSGNPAYLDIATRHGLNPCQMAIAFTQTRPFATIPIVGATSLAQLAVNIAPITLSGEVLREVAVAHKAHPQPY